MQQLRRNGSNPRKPKITKIDQEKNSTVVALSSLKKCNSWLKPQKERERNWNPQAQMVSLENLSS